MAIVEKYEKHPSIIKIKNFTQNKFSFEFQTIDREYVLKEITAALKLNKACQEQDVPTKIVKENDELFADFIHSPYNDSIIQSNIFPSCLKKCRRYSCFQKRTEK